MSNINLIEEKDGEVKFLDKWVKSTISRHSVDKSNSVWCHWVNHRDIRSS